MYRWNKYIIRTKENEKTLLFNPFNFEMVKTEEESLQEVECFLGRGLVVEQDSKEQVLLDKGILVNDDAQEDKWVEYGYMQANHSHEFLELYIMPTLNCNFACRYCFEQHKQIVMDKTVKNAIVAYVKRTLKMYNGLSVSWFGGEPMLQMELIEELSESFKQICKEQKKTYMAGITTNAYLLSFENFMRLKKCGVYAYQITIDGMPEIHDSQRFLRGGGKTFDVIMNNLIEIHQKCRSKLVNFVIRTNETKKNTDSIEEFIDYFDEKLEHDPRFTHITQIAWQGNDSDASIYLTTEELSAVAGYTKRLPKEYRGFEQDSPEVARIKLDKLRASMCPCKSGRSNHLGIAPDGTLHMCEAHYEEACAQVGKLLPDGRIDYNPNYINWITGANKELLKCRECIAYPICMAASCPYKMSLRQERSACDSTRKSVEFLMELLSKNEALCPEI